eukprot:5339168-Alexandrium_andersonii.AAC.1
MRVGHVGCRRVLGLRLEVACRARLGRNLRAEVGARAATASRTHNVCVLRDERAKANAEGLHGLRMGGLRTSTLP